MPNWFHVYCTSPRVPNINEILEWNAAHNYPLKTNSDISANLYSPTGRSTRFYYSDSQMPFITDVDINDGIEEGLVRQDIADLESCFSEIPDSSEKDRVLQHIRNTQYLVSNQIPFSTYEDVYEAVTAFILFFEKHCGGLFFANGCFWEGETKILDSEGVIDLNLNTKDPRWTREELILVLDLYFKLRNRFWKKEAEPPMLALSDYLNQLSIHPERKWNENFRNTSAVYTKLSGFASLEPDTNDKWLPASTLMKEIWREFSQDGSALEEAVQLIRGKYA